MTVMGFLDRAKKLAQQAKDFAEDRVEKRRDRDDADSAASPADSTAVQSGLASAARP